MDIFKHFDEYSRSFLSGDTEADKSLVLKIHHTRRVWEEAMEIAENDGFDEQETRLLSIAALLHDYARFEQYSRYRTFRDRDSIDHGDLAAELVEKHGLLQEDFSQAEQKIILDAVKWHNKIALPEEMTGTARKIAGAVRDADKLDILPRLLEHFANPQNGDVVWGMPYADRLSPDVEKQLLSGEPPDYSLLKTATDFGASKFNWVYDLNCRHSMKKFLKCGYLEQLAGHMPRNEAISRIRRNAENYLKEKIK